VIWDFAWLGLAGLDQQAFIGDSSVALSLFGTFLEEIKKGVFLPWVLPFLRLIGGWTDGAQLDVFVRLHTVRPPGCLKFIDRGIINEEFDRMQHRLLWKPCCSPSSSSAQLHLCLKPTNHLAML
jgi:hypothetical protein